jgi:hypothetical protein
MGLQQQQSSSDRRSRDSGCDDRISAITGAALRDLRIAYAVSMSDKLKRLGEKMLPLKRRNRGTTSLSSESLEIWQSDSKITYGVTFLRGSSGGLPCYVVCTKATALVVRKANETRHTLSPRAVVHSQSEIGALNQLRPTRQT